MMVTPPTVSNFSLKSPKKQIILPQTRCCNLQLVQCRHKFRHCDFQCKGCWLIDIVLNIKMLSLRTINWSVMFLLLFCVIAQIAFYCSVPMIKDTCFVSFILCGSFTRLEEILHRKWINTNNSAEMKETIVSCCCRRSAGKIFLGVWIRNFRRNMILTADVYCCVSNY